MKRIALISWLVAAALVVLATASASAVAPSPTYGGGSTKVVYLGTAAYHGRTVEGYAFIHGRGGLVSRPARPSKSDPLYTFLARGARWRSTETYVVNPANADGVSPAAMASAMSAAASAWEAQVTYDVFGAGSLTNTTLAADWSAPDGVNEAYFSSTELDQRTVAVTIVWGIFSGPPAARELLEWDMVFNDALPERWGDAAAGGALWDVQDIATHEIGHSAGLGDLYTTAATEQTMYGYASPGETKKRTLESGDIAGIRALYQ